MPCSAARLAFAISSAASAGSGTRVVTSLVSSASDRLARLMYRVTSSNSPSSISPRWCAAGW
ncbi:hypothetical protein [Phytohabitans suffuscus]|uniref:hypothetical protein n=1 Tax=Phytohabitans suffuscus TaxID=624315 RepID=UPI001E5FEF9A|nr:hypothetical protein [Phytohabitans suffuscus]